MGILNNRQGRPGQIHEVKYTDVTMYIEWIIYGIMHVGYDLDMVEAHYYALLI